MNANIVDNCRPANSTVDCSGRGVCSCGRCECYGRDDNEVCINLLYVMNIAQNLEYNGELLISNYPIIHIRIYLRNNNGNNCISSLHFWNINSKFLINVVFYYCSCILIETTH